MKAVYCAGPYGSGDAVAANIRKAIDAGEGVRKLGGYPFIPHLTAAWHAIYPRPYEDWMDYDAEWLLRCDAVLRIPGTSPGADREVALAQSRGIPIFYDTPTLGLWLRGARQSSNLVESGEWFKPTFPDEQKP